MQPRVTATLKALIAIMIALLLASQIFVIPEIANVTAERNPDVAQLMIPGIVGAIIFLVLVQVTLVCVWQLLSLVRADQIFSPKAFRYVDVILAMLIAAGALIAGSYVVIMLARAVSPSVQLFAALGFVVSIAMGLLVVVLRGLLTKALQLEQDMSEVV